MSFVVRPPPGAGPVIDEREAPRGSGTRGYDVIIRTNIQTIRSNLQSIEVNLRNLNRNLISRRIVESLHAKLKQTFDFILQTEAAFNSWMEEQKEGEGREEDVIERQKDKFLFETLFNHFQAEIRRVQNISEQVRSAAERTNDSAAAAAAAAAASTATTAATAANDETQPLKGNNRLILDMENSGEFDENGENAFICDDTQDFTEFDFVSENDALLTRAVEEDRYQGIRRIHAQVSQANHIFKDLANLIFSQGETLNSIETQMQDAHEHSKSAAAELRKLSRRQQRSRQRRCFLLLFIFALSFLILYTLNFFSIFALFSSSSSSSKEPLAVAVVSPSSPPPPPAAAAAPAAAAPDSGAGAAAGAAGPAAADVAVARGVVTAAGRPAAAAAAPGPAAAAPGPAAAAAGRFDLPVAVSRFQPQLPP